MDISTLMQISSSGLNVQRKRIEAISSNLANIETTRTQEGGPYRRKDVVVTALPLENEFGDVLQTALGDKLKASQVTQVVEDQNEPQLIFNPDHPDANERGYVAMPNIDMMNEMVNLMTASRTFEANITAMNASKAMAQRAIDLGR
ncbi:MAG: flagellar basal body rod protein FlgC [Nitrospinae bacterium RIFCSPLOWO2_12_FULL_47_7]|nr:MAG: flagellar basal body rod protein FlgC [Nitrospinae bacterium RIFCSPLOWO2_12_FULL_47_7]